MYAVCQDHVVRPTRCHRNLSISAEIQKMQSFLKDTETTRYRCEFVGTRSHMVFGISSEIIRQLRFCIGLTRRF